MPNRKHLTKLIEKACLWLLVSLLITSGLLLPGSIAKAGVPIPTPTAEQPTPRTIPTSKTWGDVTDLERPSKGHPKLESSLSQLLETRRREGVDEARTFAGRHSLVLDDGRVQVVIEATAETIGDLREAVEALGGEYQTHHKALLQALVPIDALEALAERSDVRLIREPRRPIPTAPMTAGTVDTEGLGPSNASAWHAAGYTGAGVRVAVIDEGFTDYADLRGTDLPASVNTYDWTGEGMEGSEHGTACAEIVHDMAPGATLDLHKIDTGVELGNAVDQAIADGVDVISMSLVWLLDGPGDGTGFLADVVDDARSHGILYATAAGNSAEQTWSGLYNDSGDDYHLWTAEQAINYFGPGDGDAWVIPSDFPIVVGLHWDDWTVVNQDYDLVLYYWDGDSWEYVAESTNLQDGGAGQTPEERIRVSAPVEAPYGVVVWRYSATRDVCLRLNAGRYSLDERTPERSVMFPADSPDAVTVGAVDVSSPYPLEFYSSRGPTFGPGGTCSGGSTKPDIAGYANVSTVSYGAGEFNGTSAATPHVAGAAALVKEAYPIYTVSQLQSYLESNAVDLGDSGKDNRYGSGRLYLPYEEAVQADFTASPTSGVAPLTVAFTNQSTGDYDTCAWDFGDGEDGTQCTATSHEYTSAGLYTVTLTVSGLGSSDTLTRTNYITVYEAVQADFTASPTEGIAPLTVDFTNESTGDYEDSVWDFGDGLTSTLESPTHVYGAAGVYTVTLTVSGLGGTDLRTRPEYITAHVSPPGNPVVVTIEDGNGSPGSTDSPVAISADNQSQNTTPIGAGEFWVVYDGSVGLTLVDVITTGRSSGFNADMTLDETNPSAVEAHILLYSGSGATIASGTGPILELLFDVDASAQPEDSSPLSFSNVLLSDELANPIPTEYTDTGQFTLPSVTLGEAVDNTYLSWTTGGDADWFGQTSVYHYDGDAAQSGDMSYDQNSWIQTTATGPGILSFYWKVSSLGAVNRLKFYIDDVEQCGCWKYDEWQLKTFLISAGNHTFKWAYTQLSSTDAGFLDKVVFVEGPVIAVESPNGGETWYHRNYYTIRWMSTENVGTAVKIELYRGEDLSRTISAGADNDGAYSWLVPPTLETGTDYRVKITSTSNPSIYDYSDAYFSINEWYQSSFGGLLVLDGDDDYAQTEDHSELDVGDETGESFTIEAWVHIRSSSTSPFDRQYIVNKSDSYSLYAVRYYDWGQSRYYGCIGYVLTLPSDQLRSVEHCRWPAYSLGWHHVALVFYQETGEARIYLDGEAFGDPYSVGSAIKDSTAGVKVGENLAGGADEVRISDVARYSGSTYTEPTSPLTCDEHTRALWHFDEFEGATVFHDACGTADNVLVGYNGAHSEGVPVHRVHLPLIIKQY